MQLRTTLSIFLPLALTFTACSSSDDESDGGVNSGADAGPGSDSGEPADGGGFPDADPPEVGPCNPVDGTGCMGEQKCLFVPNINVQQCRLVGNPAKQHEEMCNGLDCDVGLVCLNLGDGQKCYGVCDPMGSGVGCEDLGGMFGMYSCVGLTDSQDNPLLYGACDGSNGTCNPQDDTCSVGKVCTRQAMGRPKCEAEGTVQLGGDCSMENCARGGYCTDQGGGLTCYKACNRQSPPMENGCADIESCEAVSGQTFGVCE